MPLSQKSSRQSPPQSQSRTSTSSSKSSTQPPAQPKLRDSCHVCASSKIKCSKEKPTCARCAKRGLHCEYFVTKRTGRRHDSRPAPQETNNEVENTNNMNEDNDENDDNEDDNTAALYSYAQNPATNMITPPASAESTAASEWGDSFHPNSFSHHQSHHSSYHNLFPNILSPPSSTPDITAATGMTSMNTGNINFDDFLASPFSFSDLMDTSHGTSHSQAGDFLNPTQIDDHSATLSLTEDVFSNMPLPPSGPFPHPMTPPSSGPNSSDEIPSLSSFRQGASSACCLVKALNLLQQLFQRTSSVCTSSGGFDNELSTPRAIQAVIAENEQAIEATSNMLHCSCSQDPCLLHIVSLIVFKVLGWYAAAACETQSTPTGEQNLYASPHRRDSSIHSMQETGSYFEDEDQGRVAVQQVLSELHRAQRLVNLLSQRIKSYGARSESGMATPKTTDGNGDALLNMLREPVPYSTVIFDQLKADLFGRLRTLSLEIIAILRRS